MYPQVSDIFAKIPPNTVWAHPLLKVMCEWVEADGQTIGGRKQRRRSFVSTIFALFRFFLFCKTVFLGAVHPVDLFQGGGGKAC